MKSARTLFFVAAALIVLGIGVMFLEPGEPDPMCAEDELVTSGFYSEELDCPISIESWNEIADHRSGPFYFRLAGVGLIVVGIGVGVTGGVKALRGRKSGQDPVQ